MVAVADKRRVTGPSAATSDARGHAINESNSTYTISRTRLPGELRKIYVKTGLVASASGSAYLEVTPSRSPSDSRRSGLKLACTVHGPRPLPRSAPFTSQLLLSTRVKFAPFATRGRRGYVPDSMERDLASQLEIALRPVLLTEKWPKSGLDVVITVLEGEEDYDNVRTTMQRDFSIMNILSGCVNVASAAIADAGVDCVDLLSMGVAACSRQQDGSMSMLLDPCISDRDSIVSCCAVGYLQSRDEITFVWAKEEDMPEIGRIGEDLHSDLVDNSVEVALATHLVLLDALKSRLQQP